MQDFDAGRFFYTKETPMTDPPKAAHFGRVSKR